MSSDLNSIFLQDNLNPSTEFDEDIYSFENYRLNVRQLMLFQNRRPVLLAPKVVETLVALIEKRGEIISKRELMNRLWSDSFVDESNLSQNIYLLRKVLGKAKDGRDLIETFRRRGYRFNGALTFESPKIDESTPEILLNQTDSPTDAKFNALANDELSVTKNKSFDSLAVLPFASKSDDETAEYLSDGITESLIGKLSQLEGLQVVARNTVFRYKNSEIEPIEIGRKLQVSALLTGRVLKFDGHLIVRCELIEAATGWQIWGDQYDRLATDALQIQEQIAREISEHLQLKLTGEEKQKLFKHETNNSVAYRAYLEGRFFLNKRTTPSISKATAYFQKAIDLDSKYALAYVGLSDCYPLLSLYGTLTPHEAYPQAEAAARQALLIDPNLAEAHNSLGVVKLFYQWDWSGAEASFQKAIELKPSYADARQRYAMFLISQQRFTEAINEFQKACQLDPLSLITRTISAYPYYYHRRFPEAEKILRDVIELDENYSMAHFRLGLVCAHSGRLDEALVELGKSKILSGDRDVFAMIGFIEGLKGNQEGVNTILDELDRRAKAGFISAYDHALIYAGTGQVETALDSLETAYREKSYWLIYLKSDPALDSLRSHERFKKLENQIFG